MRQTYENILQLECPIFLRTLGKRDELPPEERYGITFGVQCGDGWYDLVREACHKIETINKTNNLNILCHQIKEKFGGLRIYPDEKSIPDEFRAEVYAIIQQAEIRAEQTCQQCGKTHAELNPRGMTALCDDCYEQRRRQRERDIS